MSIHDALRSTDVAESCSMCDRSSGEMERVGVPCDHLVTEATERMQRKKTRHQVSRSSMSEPAEKRYRYQGLCRSLKRIRNVPLILLQRPISPRHRSNRKERNVAKQQTVAWTTNNASGICPGSAGANRALLTYIIALSSRRTRCFTSLWYI